jgi:hypothetical protein
MSDKQAAVTAEMVTAGREAAWQFQHEPPRLLYANIYLAMRAVDPALKPHSQEKA